MRLQTFQRQHIEPMPPDRVVRSTWAVGRRTVTLTQDVSIIPGAVGTLRAEWAPDTPRSLSKREWKQYRAGRAKHCQHVADVTGAAIACAEL